MLHIRKARIEDLPELIKIENQCFSKEEAASEEAFKKRIQTISDSFFVAERNDKLVGLINGPVIETAFITDDLFSEIKANPSTGGHQSILGLAVNPDNQKQGIATALLLHLEVKAKERFRQSLTLTCKEELIRFYEKHGYKNKGLSNSQHGGIRWYNMTKEL
ncbi:GNAT family N-acetyltransferase [Niallia endozanthoxylica]|uniref:GNAT family N-acetyltransferase n=1 Tax=Niallia endozanthoxylica TaxID=2036016 RepID=A0A5J5I1M9_9BACI|nr:GNAT family N-acetyltransferase [Niallia endozanthoxylica]KAA9028450.1 GNAT family N-acetyltransferase [Niallia endozanthoxylica]